MDAIVSLFVIVALFSLANTKGLDRIMKCEKAQRAYYLYSCPTDDTFLRARCNIGNGLFKPKQCYGQWCYCVRPYDGSVIRGYKAAKSDSCVQKCDCAIANDKGLPSRKCDQFGNYQIADCFDQRNMSITDIKRCAKDGSYMPISCSQTTKTCQCIGKRRGAVLLTNADKTTFPTANCDCSREWDEYKVARQTWANFTQTKFDQDAETLYACNSIGNSIGVCSSKRKLPKNAGISCDANGKYSPLQCNVEPGRCYCVNRENGQKLGTFGHTKDNDRLNSDCKCALDRSALSAYGKNKLPNCLSDGSYKSCATAYAEWKKSNDKSKHNAPRCDCVGQFKGRQCIGDTCYCVDRNGNKIGYEVPLIVALEIKMTCDCVRDRYDYILSDKPGLRIPEFKCDRFGGYSTVV